MYQMEQHALKDIINCLNANIYSYLETSGGQSSNLYINVVHFFNTSVNLKSVAAKGSCFPPLLYNTCSSIVGIPKLLIYSNISWSMLTVKLLIFAHTANN